MKNVFPRVRSLARVPLERIRPCPLRFRRTLTDESVEALAQSIRLYGLLSPLWVRRIGGDCFELIAGERRLRALKLLNAASAEVIVLCAYDDDCPILSLVENMQRENLHYLDEAEALQTLLDRGAPSRTQLAEALSVRPCIAADRLRLMKLPPSVRALLRRHHLSEHHARALLTVTDETLQSQAVLQAVQSHFSADQLQHHLLRSAQHVSRVVRDRRIVVNAILDAVHRLNAIGIPAETRVEDCDNGLQICINIPFPAQKQ